MKSSVILLSTVVLATMGVTYVRTNDGLNHASDERLVLADVTGTVQRAPRTLLAQATAAGKPQSEAPPTFEELPHPVKPALDTVTTATTEPVVDESALRYFASRGDTTRLQAEISRLRALYPNWQPPKDPLAVPQNEDKQLEEMWKLYAAARYADVRKAIADRQAVEPAWKVPADLLERLDVAESRTRLIAASDLKQYETVVTIGSQSPSLLTCSDVDVLWRVAEAFFFTDRQQRAQDAYGYVLNNCENPAERLATVQKAAAILPAEAVENLLTREKKLADGTMEFESVRDDLARRFIADANTDARKTVPPSTLLRLERLAETGGLASDALLLGWYRYQHNDMSGAEPWFRRALTKEPAAPAAQGLALTLLDRKDPRAAEDTMYRWRDDSKDAKSVYLAASANLLALDPPVPLTPDVLRRMAQETIKARDAASAQQFGWYARVLDQPDTAIQWFRTALSWKLDDEPSAYGLAVTYQQIDDADGVARIQKLWAGRSQRIARVGEPVDSETVIDGDVPLADASARMVDRRIDRQGVARQERRIDEQPARRRPTLATRQTQQAPRREARSAAPPARAATVAPAGCKTTVDPASLAPAGALTRGWCLMERNRPLEAAAAFDVALGAASETAREEAAYGQSLAYLRAGLTSKAAVSAVKARQNPERSVELQRAIMTNRATAAFDAGRPREAILILDQMKQFGPERADLMVLRGYAYLRLKRYPDARRIFEALSAVGNPDAAQGLAIIRDVYTPG